MLAMVVNDDAGHLMPPVALASIASMLAPTAPSPSTAIKKCMPCLTVGAGLLAMAPDLPMKTVI